MNIGTVRQSSKRIIGIEVEASILDEYDDEAEYHLIVNGRVVKRLKAWQAVRLGIVSDSMLRVR